MSLSADGLNRIAKLFVDRDRVAPEQAIERLASYRLALVCGPEIAHSATLQAALLTAANVASRCFPGAVSVHLPGASEALPLRVVWPAKSLAQAVRTLAAGADPPRAASLVIFGTRPDCSRGLQVTFDGWVAAVAPVRERLRLRERDLCLISGVTAGALAVSEHFLSFAEISAEATYRSAGLSLWRPDLPWSNDDAVGPLVEFLPREAWFLGLGHLGQGNIWSFGLLPFHEPERIRVVLNDFDRVVPANEGTGLLTSNRHIGCQKTRVADSWLRRRGFCSSLVERRFDAGTKRYYDEPLLAFCGFDGDGPRSILDDVGFERVVECGLGGRVDNFDKMLMHTLPIAGQSAARLWQRDADLARGSLVAERLAHENPIYQEYDRVHACGALEIAGKSVAVPFVGAVAGSLSVAEVLRMSHGGEAFESIDLRLSAPATVIARRARCSYGENIPAVPHVRSMPS